MSYKFKYGYLVYFLQALFIIIFQGSIFGFHNNFENYIAIALIFNFIFLMFYVIKLRKGNKFKVSLFRILTAILFLIIYLDIYFTNDYYSKINFAFLLSFNLLAVIFFIFLEE